MSPQGLRGLEGNGSDGLGWLSRAQLRDLDGTWRFLPRALGGDGAVWKGGVGWQRWSDDCRWRGEGEGRNHGWTLMNTDKGRTSGAEAVVGLTLTMPSESRGIVAGGGAPGNAEFRGVTDWGGVEGEESQEAECPQ